jgi:GAF domain-containing protein
VPLLNNTEVLGVLDVDATDLDAFDETDQHYLEEIVRLLIKHTDFTHYMNS